MDKYDNFYVELDNKKIYCLAVGRVLNMYTISQGHLYDKNNIDLGTIIYMMPGLKPVTTNKICYEQNCDYCPLLYLCNMRNKCLNISILEVLEDFKPILKRKEYKRLKNEINKDRN